MAIPTIKRDNRVTTKQESTIVNQEVTTPDIPLVNTELPATPEVITLNNGLQTGLTKAGSDLRENALNNSNQPIIEDAIIEDTSIPVLPQQMDIPNQGNKSLPVGDNTLKPVTEKIKSSPKPDKIQTSQDIKNQNIANEADQAALNEQKAVKAQTEFSNMVTSGASNEELRAFAIENKEFSQGFNSVLRTHFKNKANVEFFTKYNGMSNESMYGAVKNGNLVVGSDKYNQLSQPQRDSFSQYKKTKDSVSMSPTTKKEIVDYNTSPEYTVSFSDINTIRAGMFSSNLRENVSKLLNNPRKIELESKLGEKAAQITKLDNSLVKLQDDIERTNAGQLSNATIRAMTADERQNILLEKNLLLTEYGNIQASIKGIKDNIDTEIELFQYEDELSRAEYDLMYKEYQAGQTNQRENALAIAEREFANAQTQEERDFALQKIQEEREYKTQIALFEEQNKQIAVEKALNNSKELAEFKNYIEQGNISGTWDERADGTYFLSDKGVATKVINGGFTVNNDGTTTRVYFDDNDQPIIETTDVKGNIIGASTETSQFTQKQTDLLNAPIGTIIPTRLSEVTNPNGGKECAEYINDIFAEELGKKMEDSYESKLAVATESEGAYGSIAVWQPSKTGPLAKFGHAGVIIGESEDGLSWDIKSSNFDNDGAISVKTVPKDVIAGYRKTSLFAPKVESIYSDGQVKQMQSLDPTKLNSTDLTALTSNGLTVEDFYAYRAESVISPDDISKIKAILDGLRGLKGADGTFESAEGFGGALGQIKSKIPIFGGLLPGTLAADYKNKADSVLNNLVLENLDLMTGILTDSDIAILRSAATNINTDSSSEAGFAEGLRKMEDKYRLALGLEITIYRDPDGTEYGEDGLKEELARQIKDGKATGEQVQAWLIENNINLGL